VLSEGPEGKGQREGTRALTDGWTCVQGYRTSHGKNLPGVLQHAVNVGPLFSNSVYSSP